MKQHTSSSRRGSQIAAALVALFALLALLAPAAAMAKAGSAGVATIYIKGNSPSTLRFVGPKKIRDGQLLQIVNETDPRKVGPQTFSLVEAEEIPKTAKERAQCLSKGHICQAIMGWHGIKNGGKPKRTRVNVGKEGWDVSGSTTSTGDSWYTSKKGQSIEETLSVGATAGPVVVTFMSAFDPSLHGSITVTPF